MKLIQSSTSIITVKVTVPDGTDTSNSISTIKRPMVGYAPMQYVLTSVEIPSGTLGNKVTVLGGNTRDTLHTLQKDGESIEVANGDIINPVITFGRPYIAVKGDAAASGDDVEVTLTLSQI